MMHPTYIDVDCDNPSIVLGVCENPLLSIGPPGTFDDSGITLGSIVQTENDDLVYYTGWKRRRYGVSFELSIGVARILDGGDRLEKVYVGPILSQDVYHPYLVAGPYVVPSHDQPSKYRMWYCSGTGWHQRPHGPEPIYSVFSATSNNGFSWSPESKVPLIPFEYDGEVISAPWVVRTPDSWLMYYSFRGSDCPEAKLYSIGVATSTDGNRWLRQDSDVGISKSTSGWDSEMICYPSVVTVRDTTYMFYSGNSVGKGGIGYAVASEKLDIVPWPAEAR